MADQSNVKEQQRNSVSTPDELVRALHNARMLFETRRDANCVCIFAPNYLKKLQNFLACGRYAERGERVLFSHAGAGAGAIVPPEDPLGREVLKFVAAAFEEWSVRAIFTRRYWLQQPNFHVDQAAATLIVPLRNAPTHLSNIACLSKDMSTTAPVGEAQIQMIKPPVPIGSVTTTGSSEIVLMKGLKWGLGHHALVHSPPSHGLDLEHKQGNEAVAVIVEIIRPS